MISRSEFHGNLFSKLEESLVRMRDRFDEVRPSLGKGDDKSLARQVEFCHAVAQEICNIWGHLYTPTNPRCMNCGACKKKKADVTLPEE